MQSCLFFFVDSIFYLQPLSAKDKRCCLFSIRTMRQPMPLTWRWQDGRKFIKDAWRPVAWPKFHYFMQMVRLFTFCRSHPRFLFPLVCWHDKWLLMLFMFESCSSSSLWCSTFTVVCNLSSTETAHAKFSARDPLTKVRRKKVTISPQISI